MTIDKQGNGWCGIPKGMWFLLIVVGGGSFGGGQLLDRSPKVNFEKLEGCVQTIHTQTQDLWDWHNVNDQEGVKLWYVRRSLEDAVRALSKSIQIQTDVLREIYQEQKAIRRDLEKD